MEYNFFDFLTLLGSLGFFIYGMKVMSEGIQKVAGGRMRGILRAMTSHRWAGVFTGFLLTGLVQSSSATTVMVVSFVNAGLLSLVESIGVIMGANIGTTITSWIISLVGFKMKIAAAALPIIAVGTPLLFASKARIKSWAEVIIGFALLFMGLEALKDAVPDLKSNPEVLEFLADYTNGNFFSILLFVVIGTILTVIVQSSSATMALTLVMANQGWISFDLAAAMVLGENIGTTITANLAAMVANVHAKRAARAHFIFNIFGVIWMLCSFRWFLSGIEWFMVDVRHGTSPFVDAESVPLALSYFHTFFNLINVVLLIGFVNKIANLVTKMVKSKGDGEEFRLEYITTPLLSTPEISLEEARKEIAKFADLTKRMSGYAQNLLKKKKNKERGKMMRKIKKYEEITDRVELEIAEYLSKLSTSNLSNEASLRLRGMLSIINDLERIGDLFFQMSLTIDRKSDGENWFSDGQIENLVGMLELVDDAFDIMIDNLNMDYSRVTLNQAIEKEAVINKRRDKLRKKHLKNIEKRDYDVMSGIVYADLYNLIERVGDHIINVSEAITGELARDEEDEG
ncbi:Na/Pi cotransporter family protein [Fulvivirga sediminis]|uniref:Na/Pi cotransporter family protein n=1 Tax=Fulvivirga sediminis TaxID=2803949 RepID=A0A937JXS9_9BACT|nr:Na/Pi cotransporter family protein [Fulvivirga sediminis]MBL3654939.1 Na/Pi cotransporter family protein [Fulvivirga sediminis]